MSLTESVVSAVSEKLPGAKIVRIRLEIGRLAGVVPDSVRFCFEIVAAGTELEGAELEILEPPGVAHCRQCGVMVELADSVLLCTCGSANLEVLSGTEMLIKEVEVA